MTRACLIPHCARQPREHYALCDGHVDAALTASFGGAVLRRMATVERLSSRIAEMQLPRKRTA